MNQLYVYVYMFCSYDYLPKPMGQQ